MPFYDYKCTSCNFILIDIYKLMKQDSNDYKTHICPRCGSEMKLFINSKNTPTFELKGSGWYKTDYKLKKE